MGSRIADTSFIVALLNARDEHHEWAVAEAAQSDAPWHACEGMLSEAFHILTPQGSMRLVKVSLEFANESG